MKPGRYLTQLKSLSNKENGKRRIRNSLRLSTQWVPLGEENDSDSASYRREGFNTLRISA